jgi:hypothetical protein
MLTFTVNGYRVTSGPVSGHVPPSDEVRHVEEAIDFNERLARAIFAYARKARAQGCIFDAITFDREVVEAGEL